MPTSGQLRAVHQRSGEIAPHDQTRSKSSKAMTQSGYPGMQLWIIFQDRRDDARSSVDHPIGIGKRFAIAACAGRIIQQAARFGG